MLGVLCLGDRVWIVQLTAQVFHHQFGFGTDFILLDFVLFGFLSAFFLQIGFEDFHPFLHDLLHAGDVLGCDFFASFNDGLITTIQFKADSLAYGLAGLFTEFAFQVLTLFNNRLKQACDLLIIFFVDLFDLSVEFLEFAVALFLRFGDFAVNLGNQFPL